MKHRNEYLRCKAVEAMNFLARHCNNEDHIMTWLMLGVADGDQEYEGYIEDNVFADLMDTFLEIMYRANKDDSGLYIDGIVSKEMEMPDF